MTNLSPKGGLQPQYNYVSKVNLVSDSEKRKLWEKMEEKNDEYDTQAIGKILNNIEVIVTRWAIRRSVREIDTSNKKKDNPVDESQEILSKLLAMNNIEAATVREDENESIKTKPRRKTIGKVWDALTFKKNRMSRKKNVGDENDSAAVLSDSNDNGEGKLSGKDYDQRNRSRGLSYASTLSPRSSISQEDHHFTQEEKGNASSSDSDVASLANDDIETSQQHADNLSHLNTDINLKRGERLSIASNNSKTMDNNFTIDCEIEFEICLIHRMVFGSSTDLKIAASQEKNIFRVVWRTASEVQAIHSQLVSVLMIT
jgi:hypothetical protein